MAKRNDSLHNEEIFHLYFDLLWGVSKIAAQLDVSHTSISDRLKKSGRKLRPRSFPKHRIERAVLNSLYVDQKLSARVIAKKLDVSELAVYEHLKKFEMSRGAGGIANDPVFDNLKVGQTIRLKLSTVKGNWHSNVHLKAKRRGFEVSLRKIDDNTVSVIRLRPRETEPMEKSSTTGEMKKKKVDEIRRLYMDKRWPVARIATHLGISKNYTYFLMRAAGVTLQKRPKAPVDAITKRKLTSLYITRRLAVPEIANELGLSTRNVTREL